MFNLYLLNALITIFSLLSAFSFAQFDGYVPTKNPISPVGFRFLKYGENPVNEYNGIPEVSIPIYTIDAGSVSYPISLNYHAGAIRVAEEASWVGLGWNLDFGTITQIVNDRDDLSNYTKELPDYFEFATPYEYPMEYAYPYFLPNYPPGGWPVPQQISQTNPRHSLITYTDYYIPFNNIHSQKRDFFNASGWTSSDKIDSEPDIFKVNINGTNLEFILDFPLNMNNVIILNKKGYKIEKNDLGAGCVGWIVTFPDGIKYTFSDSTVIYSNKSQMKNFGVVFSNQPIIPELKSRTWHLSKITGIDNREILFKRKYTDPIYQFPSFSQTRKYIQAGGDDQEYECGWFDRQIRDVNTCDPGTANGCSTSYDWVPPNQIRDDVGFSSIQYVPSKLCYVDTIIFPAGRCVFQTSTRIMDIYGDKQLDTIKIINIFNQTIKKLTFNYGYFSGINTGDGFDTESGLDAIRYKSSDEKLLRLKLTDITEAGSQPYRFTYNATPLPSKCSYAVDYWGFYNGKSGNTSLIPNPADLGIPSSQMPSNGNDHKADSNFIKAGTLEILYYPTGGYTQLQYGLNHFSSFYNISMGNGIRVQCILNYNNNGLMISKTNYSYESGIALSPLRFSSSDSYSRLWQYPQYSEFIYMNCNMLSSSNFYSSSLLGSGSGVGYSKVTKEQVDINNNGIGKTIHEYYNHPDIAFNFYPERNFNLPLIKDINYPENGLLHKEELWHKNGYPVKISEYLYSFHISPVYYGVMVGFNQLYASWYSISGVCSLDTREQDFCGYYPIFSGWSLLDHTIITDYQISGPSIVNQTYNYYDQNNNLSFSRTDNSEQKNIDEDYYYPYSEEVSSEAYMANLTYQNRINHPVQIRKSLYTIGSTKPLAEIHEVYDLFGPQVWMKTHETRLYIDNPPDNSTELQVDIKHDAQNHGNILEFNKRDNIKTAYVWGYNDIYQVIMGENVTSDDLNTAVNTATVSLDNLLTSIGDMNTVSQKEEWKTFNVNLRMNPLLKNALITTYTYKPLVGITSITDPAGIIKYFEYDPFCRLLYEKDNKDNIIKQYDYHYQTRN